MTPMQKRDLKIGGLIVAGVALLFVMITAASDTTGAPSSSTGQATAATPAPSVKNEPNKVVAWDGNPDHEDCSPEGHPDPKHPGERINNEDSDKPCVPNAPMQPAPPAVDPLSDGSAPDADHCFGPGWEGLPDETEGDRKCKPLRLKKQAKEDRNWKKYNQMAEWARWIDAPNTNSGDLDELYELPGEDGAEACAEVSHLPNMDEAYTVSVLNAKHNVRMSTRHMAELAAVSVCGNGRHP